MADQNAPLTPVPPPLPPQPPVQPDPLVPAPSTSTPPPASSSPSVNLSVPQPAPGPGTSATPASVPTTPASPSREEAELASLSPFAVMKKRDQTGSSMTPAPMPPVAPVESAVKLGNPVPVPPQANVPAASPAPMVRPHPGPDQPFILPAEEVAPDPIPPIPEPPIAQPIPISRPVPARPQQQIQPGSSVAKATPPLNKPMVPTSPLVPPMVTSAPKAQPVPAIVNTPMNSQTPPPMSSGGSGSRVGIIAFAGLLIALLLLVGGGYVLALRGARVPLLYAMVSGLEGDGVAVGKKALNFVGDASVYQFSGESFVQVKSTGDVPTLPAGNEDEADVVAVSAMHTTVEEAEPLAYTNEERTLEGKLNISIDSGQEVPLYLSTANEPTWLINLPANTVTPLVKTDSSMLAKTLLYPAIQPIPLGAMLSAIKEEVDYKKVEGKQVARYSYTLDAAQFNKYFPEGATIKSLRQDAEYAWKSGKPVAAAFQAEFDYQGVTYQLVESWVYSNWNTELTADAVSAFQTVKDSDALTKASQLRTSEFISQLGIAGIAALPNTVVDSNAPSEPITPTGEGITTALAPINVVPPIPSTPTADATKRDTQRLADLQDLQKALEEYKSIEGAYPLAATLVQTRASTVLLEALVPKYLTKLPVDPLKDTYWYEYVSNGSGYTLRAVAEDSSNTKAIKGKAYYYFESTK